MFRLTPLVKNLIIVNVVIFLAQKIATTLPIADYLSLWNVRTPAFKPYQLFTYMFVHDSHDFFHILFNMIGLAFFGSMLEDLWGTKKFLLFYIICGIGAGVFNILSDLFFGLGTFSVMMGASGAVYGVLTAFGVTFPNMEIRLMFLFKVKAIYLVMFLGISAILMGFRNVPGDQTAHFTHLGGIVTAIIIMQVWKFRGVN